MAILLWGIDLEVEVLEDGGGFVWNLEPIGKGGGRGQKRDLWLPSIVLLDFLGEYL